MKKRKYISFMTMLVSLPGLFAPAVLFMEIENMQLLLLAITAFLLRGVCGVVGSVMLWRGKKLGYKLASVSWAYITVVALYSLIVLHMQVPPSFEFNEINHMVYLKPLSNGLGKLIWGLPILYILIRDLKNNGSSEQLPVHS